MAPSFSFGLLDFSDDGLRGTSVSGEVRGHNEVTSDPFCQPSVALQPI